MNETRFFPVPDGLIGERADAALARLLGLSRSKTAQLLVDGMVSLNSKPLSKSERLVAGFLEVELPDERPKPEPLLEGGLKICYQDEHVIVIEKPVGVAAHRSPGWEGPTVVGALEYAGVQLPDTGVPERPGVVQRLDVGTSGLMMLAKTNVAYSVLKQAFKDRKVNKIYHAVAQGTVKPEKGTIDAPIGRHPGSEYKFAVVSTGKNSITHYQTLENFGTATLLEINLETGRTHQIRVHMQAIKHPLAGDPTYGGDPILAKQLGLNRQWLHALELSFQHPITEEPITVTGQYPDDLRDALTTLRQA